jgi:acetylornithine aminotransferase
MKPIEPWQDVFQNNYGTPEITLSHGAGVEVWDVEGNRYLDFLGGIATNILGHAHPEIIKAVSSQISKLSHISNLYAHLPGLELATRLKDLLGDQTARVFFCNSGAEANEAAIKISRLTGRSKIVAAIGGFHGRTMGALSITGQEAKREPFEPLLGDIDFVAYGEIGAMRDVVSTETAMVIVEPIQGENGVVVPPPGYLSDLRDICDEHGALFAIDAVQTGMGRTGEWFGYEGDGIMPDVMTLAKGLGGGLPLGAMITMGVKVPAFKPGQHGSTFGGNPISCAAANAAIDYLLAHSKLSKIRDYGIGIKAAVESMPSVIEVRGRGLLLGIVLQDPIAQKLIPIATSKGLLLNATNPHVIRLAPALVVTQEQIDEFVSVFAQCLAEVHRG